MPKRYTVKVRREGKTYVAICVENNVASQGPTLPDALRHLAEALELAAED